MVKFHSMDLTHKSKLKYQIVNSEALLNMPMPTGSDSTTESHTTYLSTLPETTSQLFLVSQKMMIGLKPPIVVTEPFLPTMSNITRSPNLLIDSELMTTNPPPTNVPPILMELQVYHSTILKENGSIFTMDTHTMSNKSSPTSKMLQEPTGHSPRMTLNIIITLKNLFSASELLMDSTSTDFTETYNSNMPPEPMPALITTLI